MEVALWQRIPRDAPWHGLTAQARRMQEEALRAVLERLFGAGSSTAAALWARWRSSVGPPCPDVVLYLERRFGVLGGLLQQPVDTLAARATPRLLREFGPWCELGAWLWNARAAASWRRWRGGEAEPWVAAVAEPLLQGVFAAFLRETQDRLPGQRAALDRERCQSS